VFAYRDLYPLLTFNDQPEDLHEGWWLWAKVAVLTTISIVLPSVVPSQYIPVDPTVNLNQLIVYFHTEFSIESFRVPSS
jgi:hypothetical protein